jgi:CheY-like chemotaxis protein
VSERRRVLVVDDNLEMARSVADGLGDRGYQALAVASGEQAITRLRADSIDAVVTDLRMPRVDGLQLLAESRKLDPRARRPFCFCARRCHESSNSADANNLSTSRP